jgi:hypothetical protein
MPDALRRFILASIPSVPYLEALLLLRSTPGEDWDSFRLAARLYTGERQAQELLQALLQRGVATPVAGGCVRYAPSSRELAAFVDAVAQVYASNLVGIADLIHQGGTVRAD